VDASVVMRVLVPCSTKTGCTPPASPCSSRHMKSTEAGTSRSTRLIR